MVSPDSVVSCVVGDPVVSPVSDPAAMVNVASETGPKVCVVVVG